MYCFVVFSTQQSADRALEELDGAVFDGRSLELAYARPLPASWVEKRRDRTVYPPRVAPLAPPQLAEEEVATLPSPEQSP